MSNNKKVVKVCITGAAGKLCYSLIPMISNGDMFGSNTKLELRLLEIPSAMETLNGFVMELEDSAYPLVTKYIPTTSPKIAFQNVDYCVLVGALPRTCGMSRIDLLEQNGRIFKAQGKYLEKYAKKSCKVLVVGNPANTNAYLVAKNAPKIPKKNFTSLSRLDLNRAKGQINRKLKSNIKNVIIFGNHSDTQVPYCGSAYVEDINGKKIPFTKFLMSQDQEIQNWINKDFRETIKTRGGEVIKARGHSSATSAGKSCCDHFREWLFGTPKGQWASMGVYLEKEVYGIKDLNIFYSLPCICKDGEWKIVEDLIVDKESQKLIEESAKELVHEKKKAQKIKTPRDILLEEKAN